MARCCRRLLEHPSRRPLRGLLRMRSLPWLGILLETFESYQILGYRFRSFFRGRTSLGRSGPEPHMVGSNLIQICSSLAYRGATLKKTRDVKQITIVLVNGSKSTNPDRIPALPANAPKLVKLNPGHSSFPHTIPNSLPASAKAAIAKSMSASVSAADICVRMRALPFGTTGKKNPATNRPRSSSACARS